MANAAAGKLDQRVTLAHKVRAKDGHAGSLVTFTDYATVWAEVRPLSGRERVQAQREEATANYVVTIRLREDVVEGDRISWSGRYLNVRFVAREGDRERFLKIEAELGAAA